MEIDIMMVLQVMALMACLVMALFELMAIIFVAIADVHWLWKEQEYWSGFNASLISNWALLGVLSLVAIVAGAIWVLPGAWWSVGALFAAILLHVWLYFFQSLKYLYSRTHTRQTRLTSPG